MIGFTYLADIFSKFTIFLGQVTFGVIVIAIGFYLSNVVAKLIAKSSAPEASILAAVSRVAILILGFAMGLQQMGIAEDVVIIAFGLVLGAISIAAGLAFGLGGKDSAANYCKVSSKNLLKSKPYFLGMANSLSSTRVRSIESGVLSTSPEENSK